MRQEPNLSRLAALMESIGGDRKKVILDAYRERILEIGRDFGAEVLQDHGCNEGMESLEDGWFRSPANRPFDVEIEGYRLQVYPARSFPIDRIKLYRKDGGGDVGLGEIGFGVPGHDSVDLSVQCLYQATEMDDVHAAANDLLMAFDDAAELYRLRRKEPAPEL